MANSHLLVLYNPTATRGADRHAEIKALEKLDWASQQIITIGRLSRHSIIVEKIVQALQQIDSEAGRKGATVTLVSVGGDGTHNTALAGLIEAGILSNTKVRLAIAGAGNKNDFAQVFGTDGFNLTDIVKDGQEVKAYPIEISVTKAGQADRSYLALGSASLGTIAQGAVLVNGDAFRHSLSKKKPALLKLLDEYSVTLKAVWQSWDKSFHLQHSDSAIRSRRPVLDMTFAGNSQALGGHLRYRTSLHEPKEFVVTLTRKSLISLMNSMAARSIGRGLGGYKIKGQVTLRLKGIKHMQTDGEVRVINDNPEDGEPITISVNRAKSVTVLRMPVKPSLHATLLGKLPGQPFGQWELPKPRRVAIFRRQK